MKTLLEHNINEGHIYISGQDYIGIARDGEHVHIGNVGKESQIEIYLTDHPDPSQW